MPQRTVQPRSCFAPVALVSLMGVVCPAAVQETLAPVADAPPGYRLAWSDEFNGSSVDAHRWRPRIDTKMGSRQRPENISVGGGVLLLRVDRNPGASAGYSGAGLISRESFRYGYYEARLRVPDVPGWHTSFWMMSEKRKSVKGYELSVQEIDVMENDSGEPTRYYATVHRWKPEPHFVLRRKAIPVPDLSRDFHVFGCELTSDLAIFRFNGRVVRTYDMRSIAQSHVNIWVSVIASGKRGIGNVDESRLPSVAEFDYVRYFTKRDHGITARSDI